MRHVRPATIARASARALAAAAASRTARSATDLTRALAVSVVRRLRLTTSPTEGAHSWSDWGVTTALSLCLYAVARIPMRPPASPPLPGSAPPSRPPPSPTPLSPSSSCKA